MQAQRFGKKNNNFPKRLPGSVAPPGMLSSGLGNDKGSIAEGLLYILCWDTGVGVIV